MSDAPRYQLNHSPARTVAALLGTMPLALATGIALTLALPVPLGGRILVGTFSVFPLWVTFSSVVFLARSGRRAWLLVLGMLALAAAVAALATVARR